ncbi:hypothetical protein ABZW11_18915 [Nonomuraea sp. NPDC004580]|uniref:hypothetical protein n=1 Tax=Nonomuraea sp. NPDC004580 TaxID=3154552 RepID=UPI00339FF0AB
MPTTSATVLTSGTSNAAKLFVAALAFTSAYVGFSAYSNAGTTEPRKAAEPAPIVLAARAMPASERLAGGIAGEPGALTVSALPAEGCARSYVARTFLANPDPDDTVLYRWKLTRYSPATKTWRTYLSDHDGFATAGRTVEWRAEVNGTPGWYRVELSAEGAETVKSPRFEVSC